MSEGPYLVGPPFRLLARMQAADEIPSHGHVQWKGVGFFRDLRVVWKTFGRRSRGRSVGTYERLATEFKHSPDFDFHRRSKPKSKNWFSSRVVVTGRSSHFLEKILRMVKFP